MKKFLLLCGIAAPLVYLFTVILGGLLRPDYSHFAQAISALIESGAPNKFILDPLFALYNLLTLAFGFGLVQVVRADVTGKRKLAGTLGAAMLILEGVFGFATIFFPQDPGGPPVTSTGTIHIVLASLSSLTTMLTMLLMGFWFRTAPDLRRYGMYSFISVLVVFLAGGLAATTVPTASPFGGLAERLTIGGFLQWIFFVALKLYSEQRVDTAHGTPKAIPVS